MCLPERHPATGDVHACEDADVWAQAVLVLGVNACRQMCKRWRAFVGTDRPPGPGGFHSSWAFCLATCHTPVAAGGGGCGGSPGAGASREAGREREMEAVPAVLQSSPANDGSVPAQRWLLTALHWAQSAPVCLAASPLSGHMS